MPHCQICNFCETTDTPGDYVTEAERFGNVVRYYPKIDKDLCRFCVEAMKTNIDEYRFETEEEFNDLFFDDDTNEDFKEEVIDERIRKNTLALSESDL